MKKYIVSVLIPCLLLQFVGCYSFQPISVEDKSELINLENKDVRFTLSTGETVSSEAYHHTLILYPSVFIIGKGNRYFNSSNSFESFEGKVLINDIDSVSINKQQSIYTVWLKSKDRIRFLGGDYFVVRDKTEPGFWYWDKNTAKKVDVNETSSIEADKFNVVNTILLSAAALTVLIFALAGLAASQMNLHFFPGGSI